MTTPAEKALAKALRAVLNDFDREPTEEYLGLATSMFLAALSASGYIITETERIDPELDVGRVVQAVVNIAKRHCVGKEPAEPPPLMLLFGYSRATPDMDAEIAAEYARLAALSPKEPSRE
jgi:hypothetical protein